MDFEYSAKTLGLMDRLEDFMQSHILPANQKFHELAAAGTYPLEVIEPLKAKAFEAGL